MHKDAEITVVIPNYNGASYLDNCLQALQNQEPGTPDFTVLVVDDASADESAEILKKWAAEDREAIGAAQAAGNRKVVFLTENSGFCHAVNEGIKAAKTPYVILLNNDTKVLPGFVRGLYQAIEKDGKIFSVSARMLMWDAPELLDDAGDLYCALGWAYARGKGKPREHYRRPVEIFSSCGGASIYRRAVFEEIGLFDEAHFAYLEDLDMGWRARIYGYRNWYEPSAEVLHFGSASTGSRYNQRKTELSSANNIYVIGKNMPLLQLLLNLPLLLLGFAVKTVFFWRKEMGGIYLKGLWQGFCRSCSPSGRERHVAFCPAHLRHYVRIQWELYRNIFLFFKKS